MSVLYRERTNDLFSLELSVYIIRKNDWPPHVLPICVLETLEEIIYGVNVSVWGRERGRMRKAVRRRTKKDENESWLLRGGRAMLRLGVGKVH